nr:MAG TPA: hypothetical protein [Caudoviricetes sp.]
MKIGIKLKILENKCKFLAKPMYKQEKVWYDIYRLRKYILFQEPIRILS